MKCKDCGRVIPSGAKFCAYCGARPSGFAGLAPPTVSQDARRRFITWKKVLVAVASLSAITVVLLQLVESGPTIINPTPEFKGRWSVENLASPGARHVSVAYDTNGDWAAAFNTWVMENLTPNLKGQRLLLRFSTRRGSSWTTVDVDRGLLEDPLHIEGISLAFGKDHHPAIVYAHNDAIKFATRSGMRWVVEILDEDSSGITDRSLAFDKLGNPAVAYFAGTSLRLARWNGKDWLIQGVDDLGQTFVSGLARLAFDQQDNPTICYTVSRKDNWEDYVKLATWQEGRWNTQVVDLTDGQSNFSLAFDLAGYPAVAYRTVDGGLSLSRYDGIAWVKEIVPIRYPFPAQPELVFDSNSNPIIAYFAYEGDEGIRVARFDATGWLIEVIERGHWAGDWRSLSLARNEDDRLAVAYYHAKGKRGEGFKFAERLH